MGIRCYEMYITYTIYQTIWSLKSLDMMNTMDAYTVWEHQVLVFYMILLFIYSCRWEFWI